MEWIKIDKDNLPTYEVLAGNFKSRSFGFREKIIGYLSESAEGGIQCENENQILYDCTHYIDIDNYDAVE
jgi:hypothetical protein